MRVKILGAVTTVLGFCWLILTLPNIFLHLINEKRSEVNYISFLMSFLLVSLPGTIGIFFGFSLLKNLDSKNVARCLGLLVFCGGVWLATELSKFFSGSLGSTFSIFLTLLFMFPIYLLLKKFFAQEPHIKQDNQKNIIKLWIMLVAFFLWLTSSQILNEYLENKEVWSLLELFAPILIAWIFYKVSVCILIKRGTNGSDV